MDKDTIYTSYYAQIRNMPEDVCPISISRGIPDWYKGDSYTDLAPTFDMIALAKAGRYDDYTREYEEEVLENLDADEVVESLQDIAGDKCVCLICYEKPSDFCHRHLVASWLEDYGYSCEEMTFNS